MSSPREVARWTSRRAFSAPGQKEEPVVSKADDREHRPAEKHTKSDLLMLVPMGYELLRRNVA
jgi:hypothetical protein